MNLGIVIAVSDYGSTGNNLPGCYADGLAISKILQTDNKFDDVLYLSENTGSGTVKPELIKFINSHKDNEIHDVVFYFTGHGDFSGDEFYYLLSDYDKKRRKQTSLENTELDNLLKTLNPVNAIKIVDACHSGTPYIKDADAFDSYLKGTQGEFKKCYFMFSSQTEQYSYQDEKLSYFTKSIVESVQKHTSDLIRYKDVIDYVSDSFSETHSQTPFFIVQADFTESFCSVSETLRASLRTVLDSNITQPESKDRDGSGNDKSLLDLVREDSERYCTEEEAIALLSKFLDGFKDIPLEAELRDLYEVHVEEINEYSEIPSSFAIGKWLDTNEHDFFAQAYKEEVKVKTKVYKNLLKNIWERSTFDNLGIDDDDDNDYKYVTKVELRIRGFRSTIDIPVKLLKITSNSKFPNIKSASAFIVPIISKTEMRVFFSYCFYDQKDWNEKKIDGSVKWLTKIIDIKNERSHSDIRQEIMGDFSTFIYTPIAEKFNLIEVDSENDHDEGNA
ncbi:caspase family protein [Pseudoalteromonas gelatinilytica]|uniref:Caspase family protein n=1 Tax=Pseudoalteromonas gelatinilytica TaxID=1703256 RepID=A0A3A3EKR0_9GAMM|nr:caspase family protein [Pseudoalteromonas profundi]RJF36910.1 caspase family protein [Pseudoalteromonas profundi]